MVQCKVLEKLKKMTDNIFQNEVIYKEISSLMSNIVPNVAMVNLKLPTILFSVNQEVFWSKSECNKLN